MMRLLVVGGGNIGEKHIRCFMKADPMMDIDLCELKGDRQRYLATQYPIKKTATTLSELSLYEYDAAVIATPAHTHIPIALELAKAGCHLLIEKPLCVEEEGVAELHAVAGHHGLVVGVGYTYKSHPELVRMALMVRRGEIGKAYAARVALAYDYATINPDYHNSYFARSATGGGAVQDIASHAVAYLLSVLGSVEDVHCVSGKMRMMDIETEDFALLTLRFDGALAEVWASACQMHRCSEFEIVGTEGHLRYRTLWDAGKTELAFSSGNGWDVLEDRPLDTDEPFVLQARNFMAAIRGHGRIHTTLEDAVSVHRVCMEARK